MPGRKTIKFILTAGVLVTGLMIACVRSPEVLEMPGHEWVRCVYRAKIKKGSESGTAGLKLASMFSPAGEFRIEALGPMGGTKLVLIHGGGKTVLIIPPEKMFIEDDFAAISERLTGQALSPDVFRGLMLRNVSLVRGGGPETEEDRGILRRVVFDDGYSVRYGRSSNGSVRFVSPGGDVLLSLNVTRCGVTDSVPGPDVFRYDYDDEYRKADLDSLSYGVFHE